VNEYAILFGNVNKQTGSVRFNHVREISPKNNLKKNLHKIMGSMQNGQEMVPKNVGEIIIQ
jgi:uncharacterized protein YdeI (YjbR/CyaY-like superfamily)